MKRILIIHPEGNVNSNPNLHGILEILSENGFTIDLFSDKRLRIVQTLPFENTNVFLEDKNNPQNSLDLLIHKLVTPYHCVIGVDLGILEATRIAKLQKIPVGLISFEILFADEIGEARKAAEIVACKNIDFAIVQDHERGELLAEENRIAIEKLIYIPVAGRSIVARDSNHFLHERLGLSFEKKIAIMTGSVAEWSLPFELISSVKYWPEDWVLVIHSRYGIRKLGKQLTEHIKQCDNIYLSEEIADSPHELNRLLQSATVGLAFYKATFDCEHTGKNIEKIGLSSGKISTYLANGLPIVVSPNESLRSLFVEHQIGAEVEDFKELPQILQNCDFSSDDCHLVFQNELSLDQKIAPFLERLNQYSTVGCGLIDSELIPILKELFQESGLYKDLTRSLDEKEKILSSTSYKMMDLILNPKLLFSRLFRRG